MKNNPYSTKEELKQIARFLLKLLKFLNKVLGSLFSMSSTARRR